MLDGTVFVIGNEEFTDECVRGLYPDFRVLGSSEDPAEAKRLVRDWEPGLVLIDADGLEHPLRAAQLVCGVNPEALVFLAAGRPTPALIRSAVTTGVREVLRRPIQVDELRKALEQVEGELRRRLPMDVLTDEDADDNGGADLVLTAAPHGRPLIFRQQLIAVYSPKGGSGKTTIAVNLAAAYRVLAGPETRVLLVEFDPYGNLPIQLQWSNVRHTTAAWREIEDDGSGLGWPVVQELVNQDSKTGIYLLPAPGNLVDSTEIDATVTRRILQAARRHFDVVVCDCASDLTSDPTLVALQTATRLLMVVTPDLPSLNRVAGRGKAGEVMVSDVVGVDPQKLRIILNRVQKRTNLPLKDIVRRLPFRLGVMIPEDRLVQLSANVGKVPVLAWPNSPFSREIRRLAGVVAPDLTRKEPAGLLGRVASRWGVR